MSSFGKPFLRKILKKFSTVDFDFLIFVYDDSRFDEPEFSCCRVVYEKNLKWGYAKKYLSPEVCSGYDYLFFWDEDVDVCDFDYKNFLRLMNLNAVEMAQPALKRDSFFTWEITLKNDDFPVGRFTNFVECGPALVFSFTAWCRFWEIIDPSVSSWGWGYDCIARAVCGFKRQAIIDCESVRHARPVSSCFTNAHLEMIELFRKHNLFEFDFVSFSSLLNIAGSIEDEFFSACNRVSDINEHLPVLRKYALECARVTELGVRGGESTRAFLVAKPLKLISIDLYFDRRAELLKLIAESDWDYLCGNSLEVSINETDLLFIDTLHCYSQLKKELELHSLKTRKFIILHDTVSFGFMDEGSSLGPGLMPAVKEFLEKNPCWGIKEHLLNNNGLLVLQRDSK
jgi:hypothetical protein